MGSSQGRLDPDRIMSSWSFHTGLALLLALRVVVLGENHEELPVAVCGSGVTLPAQLALVAS